MRILNAFEDSGYRITEYTTDGTTISAKTKELIIADSAPGIYENTPTIEEQILVETQYQTILLEMVSMF